MHFGSGSSHTSPLLPVTGPTHTSDQHTHTVDGGDICEVLQRMIINLSFMSDSAELCRLLTASP